jgi:hypothetical protein
MLLLDAMAQPMRGQFRRGEKKSISRAPMDGQSGAL